MPRDTYPFSALPALVFSVKCENIYSFENGDINPNPDLIFYL